MPESSEANGGHQSPQGKETPPSPSPLSRERRGGGSCLQGPLAQAGRLQKPMRERPLPGGRRSLVQPPSRGQSWSPARNGGLAWEGPRSACLPPPRPPPRSFCRRGPCSRGADWRSLQELQASSPARGPAFSPHVAPARDSCPHSYWLARSSSPFGARGPSARGDARGGGCARGLPPLPGRRPASGSRPFVSLSSRSPARGRPGPKRPAHTRLPRARGKARHVCPRPRWERPDWRRATGAGSGSPPSRVCGAGLDRSRPQGTLERGATRWPLVCPRSGLPRPKERCPLGGRAGPRPAGGIQAAAEPPGAPPSATRPAGASVRDGFRSEEALSY
uniref:translation initiation factor IF-2-like n=1 Tax=Euleptes europaea TaxID=460621 RepID=UPI002540D118|nr:translation initiation factor IF-2-like [Euleptes europaea]